MTEPIDTNAWLTNGPEFIYEHKPVIVNVTLWAPEWQIKRKVKRGRHKELRLSHDRWCAVLLSLRTGFDKEGII
ncbi:hypothetical protein UFOVP75_215 [uncultured Caudovirales phage]|uniref:Uncharacterized protein n=1 Tax=uncultured Caudovirales phage TaxID=2100421 RepID=A0A6J5L1F6_9CAUD|nr:hypothetical protein UFOVP75_215 [uncultured Caudovirales phage]